MIAEAVRDFTAPIQCFLVLLPSALSPLDSLVSSSWAPLAVARVARGFTLLTQHPQTLLKRELATQLKADVSMTNSDDRPLYLHISALSPDEYQLYTGVLSELAGPGQDDSQGVWDRPVDVMEARGWVRGRYGLDAGMVDKVRVFLLLMVREDVENDRSERSFIDYRARGVRF